MSTTEQIADRRALAHQQLDRATIELAAAEADFGQAQTEGERKALASTIAWWRYQQTLYRMRLDALDAEDADAPTL